MTIHPTKTMDDIFQQIEARPFTRIHFANDSDSQLQVIVAIHSTVLGPALGGCRFVHYPSTQEALKDVLNLAQSMTYKAAFNRVAFGGGKAVILTPEKNYDRRILMECYGDFIESLGGQFITAVDSGTGTDDMDIVAQRTKHVVCTSKLQAGSGDPSPHTARGVLRGIQAAAKYIFNRDKLEGLHILIQGVGHVGYHLAAYLHECGAKLSISDINKQALVQCQDEFSASIVEPDKVYTTDCDIFSPCALGQIINAATVNKLKTKVIAGSANNQLVNENYGEILRQQGILYAPDYVINSGGLLQIAYINDENKLIQEIDKLYDSLLMIFKKSEELNISTNLIANQMAKQYLREYQQQHKLSVVQSN